MRDLEQRIDIVDVDLPELENLHRLRVNGREGFVGFMTREEIVFVVENLVPDIPNSSLCKVLIRIAAIREVRLLPS